MSSWPYFERDEIDAAASVLNSGKVNYWTGSEGRSFESEFAAFVGSRFAVAVSNGTVALELALISLGIGDGDEVIIPSASFFATASAVARVGATPVCVDLSEDALTISPAAISAAISSRTKAVICVHLAGIPCDMTPILEIIDQHQLFLIEDCAQAHGAMYEGRKVGSFGHVSAFSFCQDKIMTTGGEGGMLVTNDESAYHRAWSFKDHGKDFSLTHSAHSGSEFRWLHHNFGTNWRLSEVQSAIGRIQLQKLPDWISQRQRYASIYSDFFRSLSCGTLPVIPSQASPSWYKYYFFLDLDLLKSGWTRQSIIDAIRQEGVPCFSGSCFEIYLEKAFSQRGDYSECPTAHALSHSSLMFLLHPTLSADDITTYCECIHKVLSQALETLSK